MRAMMHAACHMTQDASRGTSVTNAAMMQAYVDSMPDTSVEGVIYKGMLLVHLEQYEAAKATMQCARELLNTRVSALVSESYPRAYRAVVLTQQVVELEEVLAYKMLERQVAVYVMTICICVCMYVCMYVYMYVCMYVCM